MSTKRVQASAIDGNNAMLRWYPAEWRARYGDEFAAMIEDDLAGKPATLRYRRSIARSGIHEQLREIGLVGDSGSPRERMQGGALTVLCAFALFIISGVGFAKISEHWDESIHQGSRHVPAVSFNLVASLAGACGLAVVVAALAVLPIFMRFLRTGGWSAIRRWVQWAVAATAATAAAVAGLSLWASHLTNHQRNSGFGWYQFVFVIAAILFAITLATWSAAVVATTRRLDIGSGQIKVAGVMAILVAVCMPVMTAASAVWWGSMAATAPWFLAGTHVGSSPSPVTANLLAVLIVMLIASAAGAFGMLKVARSWRFVQNA
jgi:hypothetical protein